MNRAFLGLIDCADPKLREGRPKGSALELSVGAHLKSPVVHERLELLPDVPARQHLNPTPVEAVLGELRKASKGSWARVAHEL